MLYKVETKKERNYFPKLKKKKIHTWLKLMVLKLLNYVRQ